MIGHDFKKLSNSEVAQLYAETRREYIKERDGEGTDTRRPKTAGNSKLHLVSGAVCDCSGGLASHYPEEEKAYVDPSGGIATMQDGEDLPLNEEQRQTRFFESMSISEVSRLSQADQFALQEWRDARAEQIAQEFRAARPKYNPLAANHLALLNYLAVEHLATVGINDPDDADDLTMTLLARGCFTVQALCEAYDALVREGKLTPLPGDARKLDADELRTLSAYCIGCETDSDFERVLDSYIRLSTGSNRGWRDAALDARYSKVLEQAIAFCFENSTPDYSPTPERRRFLKKHLSGRFPSIRLLRAGWELCKQAETKGELEQDEPPAPRLTDEDRKVMEAQDRANEIARLAWEGI